MGTIIYGSGERRIQFDDHTLAHVKSIVLTKLRRQECFTLSWLPDPAAPGGVVSIWLHPSIPMEFAFDEIEIPALDREWLANMMVSSTASGDVRVSQRPLVVAA